MQTFNGQITFKNNMESTEVFSNNALEPILKAAAKKFPISARWNEENAVTYWSPDFFGLPALGLYQKLSANDQQKVLFHCNRLVLEEAFYIEKSGMTYAAKMALLADTNDKRALYSLFCADEVSHFFAINSYMLEKPDEHKRQNFLLMLDQLIHEGSYNVLVFMIQIILEGWGLQHYLSLASGCSNPGLTEVLRSIIHDEGKHHGSGLVILPQQLWTEDDSSICLPLLERFIENVRVGPTNLSLAFSSALGPLTLRDKRSLFIDTQATQKIHHDLAMIRNYIDKYTPHPDLTVKLSAKPIWEPVSAFEFSHI